LATVTTIGYIGFLIGPPMIGFAAEWIGLRGALSMLLVTSGLIVALAPAVRLESRRRDPSMAGAMEEGIADCA
jgi:MFS family permease